MTLKVGIYDAPQVSLKAAPNVRIDMPNPNIGGALAQGISAVGDAIAQEEQRISQKRVEEFDNKLTTFDLQQRAEVAKVKGQAAFAPSSDGTDPLQLFKATRENFIQEQTKDLTPKQREVAMALAAKHGVRVQAEWAQHQDNELQAWQKSVAIDGAKVQADAAMANVNNAEAFNEALGKMAYHIQEANPGVEVTETIREQQSRIALGSLKNLIGAGTVVQPDGYQHLFTKLTANDKATADELMAKGNAANIGLLAGQQVWYPGMTRSAMVSVADSMAGDNAAVHDAIMREFSQRDSNHREDMKRYDQDTTSGILYNVYTGKQGTNVARKQIDLDASLSKDAKERAIKDLRQFEKSNKESSEDMFPKAAKFVVSDNFGGLTKAEITKALPNYGNLAHWVFSQWQQASAESAVRVPAVAKSAAITRLLGEDAKNKAKLEEIEPALNEALLIVNNNLTEGAKGRGVYASKQPDASQIAADVVRLVKPRLVQHNYIFKDVKVPVALMTPEQAKGLINSLDYQTRRMVEIKLAESGAPPTAEEVAKILDDLEVMKVDRPKEYIGLADIANPRTTSTTQARPMRSR